jgi:hypothetical protein
MTMKPADNRANMPNANKGTSGTNIQYDKAQGHRGGQINPQTGGGKKPK